jgi:DNA-directed RNA polymerase I subunit RPA43
VGKVNLCSPDHISLLVHKVFNASIPRHHIPTDQWEFEHGPADNDPEFAPEEATNAEVAVPKDIEMDQGPDATNDTLGGDQPPADGNAESEETANRGGRWVHNITSERIGGTTGYLEFTVIGSVTFSLFSVLG